MNQYAKFDQLYKKLDEQLQVLNQGDLDNIVNTHKNATLLHSQCHEILNSAELSLDSLEEEVEWHSFKAAKIEIEQLMEEIEKAESLEKMMTAYKRVFNLIREYQKQLEIIRSMGNILDDNESNKK